MLFNSYIFIFLFFPIVLLGWFTFNKRKFYKTADIFLFIMSLWFYSYTNIYYLLLILGSILLNFSCSYLIDKSNHKKWISGVGVFLNLALLFYFKYYDFFLDNINQIFKTNLKLLNIALPLGISFFTFQQISFLVDRAKGSAPHYTFSKYAVFVSFFPQLVAGPIVKHDDMIPQFEDINRRKVNWENIAKGIVIFVVGLSKKVLLADRLNTIVNFGFENISSLDSVSALVVMIAYTMQIFFDFSGYCDMAVGLGKIINIDIPINFNSPYKSKSIKEFWRRWHITLNKFFTEYVYIPLGGNRKGRLRTFINVLIVFLLSGLWHGANWTFVLWGLAHGIIIAVQSLDIVKIKNKFLSWIMTFSFINLAWVLFRSDSINSAIEFYKRLFSFKWNGMIQDIAYKTDDALLHIPISIGKKINAMAAAPICMIYMLLILGIPMFLCTRKSSYEYMNSTKMSGKTVFGMMILFAMCVISFSGVTAFIYSNF